MRFKKLAGVLLAIAGLAVLPGSAAAAPGASAPPAARAYVVGMPAKVTAGESFDVTFKYWCRNGKNTKYVLNMGLWQAADNQFGGNYYAPGGQDSGDYPLARCTGKVVTQTFRFTQRPNDGTNPGPTKLGTANLTFGLRNWGNRNQPLKGNDVNAGMDVQVVKKAGTFASQGTPPRLETGYWVDVNTKGTTATWKVALACPKDKKYDLTAYVADLDTGLPWDDGDLGVVAQKNFTGTCSGKLQARTLVLPVGNGPDGKFYPMSEKGGNANVTIALTGRGFGTNLCAHEACAGIDIHPRPYLR